jgi:hypothetical protein
MVMQRSSFMRTLKRANCGWLSTTRFKTFFSLRISHFVHRREEVMRLMDRLPDGECVFCAGKITQAVISVMADGRDPITGEPFSVVNMRGRCAVCDVVYYLHLHNAVANPDGWQLRAPSTSELFAPLSDAGIAELNVKLLRYEAVGKKWQEFVKGARETDRLWRFVRADDGRTGITHVRSGIPIDRFETFGNL